MSGERYRLLPHRFLWWLAVRDSKGAARHRAHAQNTGRPYLRVAAWLLAAFAGALLLAAPAIATARRSRAHTAATVQVNDTGHLHKTSGRGITINQVLDEQGSASGSIPGSIYIHLRLTSVNRVTAEVNIYPHGGFIGGQATASFRSSGATASFNGTLRITHGSGRYNHAYASALSFTGTVARVNDAITVHVNGRMSI